MKRILFAAAALMTLAGCQKDEVTTPSGTMPNEITASFEQTGGSRVAVDNDGKLTWTAEDSFYLFDGNDNSKSDQYLINSADAGKATASFTRQGESQVSEVAYGVFPATAEPAISEGKVRMSLTNDMTALPMLAKTSSVTNISFKHLCAALRISLSEIPAGYTAVIVEASNPICGTFEANLNDTDPVLEAVEGEADLKTSVVAKSWTSGSTAEEVDLALPVGTYASLVVKIAKDENGTDAQIVKSWSNLEVKRAKLYTTSASGDVIFLKDQDDLFWFADQVNNEGNTFDGKTVKLISDIALTKDWTPIGKVGGPYFQGTFDGQGKTISNIQVNTTGAAGLFGAVQNCIAIKHVKLDQVTVTSDHYAGALVGFLQENGNYHKVNGVSTYFTPTISGCEVTNVRIEVAPTVSDSSYDNGDKAGGLIGYAASDILIEDCSVSTGSVKGYRDLGGLLGMANSTESYGYVTVKNCSVSNMEVNQDFTNSYKNSAVDVATVGTVLGRGSFGEESTTTTDTSNKINVAVYNTDQAQLALDAATTPRTITLAAGNYGDLLLRVNEFSELTDYYYIMGNYDANYYGQEAWRYAKRAINDLHITGVGEVSVNSITTTANRDDEGNVMGTRNNMFEINNLQISKVAIGQAISFNTTTVNVATSSATSIGVPHVKINGLVINKCTTKGDDVSQASGRKLLGIANTGSSSNVKNVRVTDCEVSKAYQGVYIVDGENVEISGCTFNALTHNAVHINKFCSGQINIIGNNMSSITERPIRLNGVQSGSVTIQNNTMTDSGDAAGEYYKASAMNDAVIVSWVNNTADGEAIVLSGTGNNQVGTKQVTE